MPSHEVIDLLSSDDDPKPTRPSILQGEKKAPPPLKRGFVDLGDDSDRDDIISSTQLVGQSFTNPGVSRPKKQSGGHGLDIFEADEPEFPASKRRKKSGLKDKSEPIVFTSSPHGTLNTSLLRKRILGSPLSSDSDLDDLYTTGSLLHNQLSNRNANLLADIIGNAKSGQKRESPRNIAKSSGVGVGKGKARDNTLRSRSPSLAQSEIPDQPLRAKKARPTAAKKDLKERERALKERKRELEKREKEMERLRKVTEKDDEKEKKRLGKEAKAKEKVTAAALAEVNRSNTDKRLSAKELIVDLPSSTRGQKVDIQIREFLQSFDVETTTYDSVIPNVIKWRRKTARRFNKEMGHWEPAPLSIQCEKHVMCLLSAKEFVALATPKNADAEDLEAHVTKLKAAHKGCKPIYLIEGLEALMRKAKNSKNRAYQAAVLSQMDDTTGAGSKATTSRRKKTEEDLEFDEDGVETALLRLQVMQGCLIHQTAATVETAEWVSTFTLQISTIPDKTQRAQLETGFCVDVGQVKTGDDKEDTYYKMLQQPLRVTPGVAYGVAAKYPNVLSLVKGMRKHGPLALEDLEKSSNRNGAVSNGRIGPALSKRLHKIFMSTDPTIGDI